MSPIFSTGNFTPHILLFLILYHFWKLFNFLVHQVDNFAWLLGLGPTEMVCYVAFGLRLNILEVHCTSTW